MALEGVYEAMILSMIRDIAMEFLWNSWKRFEFYNV